MNQRTIMSKMRGRCHKRVAASASDRSPDHYGLVMDKPSCFPTMPNERQPQQATCRNQNMAGSEHAYIRGNTAKSWQWMNAAWMEVLPNGPPVWNRGNCHVGNLGPLANADGGINALGQESRPDNQIISDPTRRLIRLGLSVPAATPRSDLARHRHRVHSGAFQNGSAALFRFVLAS